MHSLKHQNPTPTSEDQHGIVFYGLEQKVVESRQWNCQEKAPRQGPPHLMDDLVSVDMSISQAPPSFRRPVTQKKACSPPFKVQVSVRFGNGGSQLPVKVNAYSLSADSLGSFLKQSSQGCLSTSPSDGGLANASIFKCLENRRTNSDGKPEIVRETFEFVDMHFKSSSRMALRWLLFVARIRDDVICILYKHPTIVLSRKTDQYSKACEILARGNPVLEITDRSSSSQVLSRSFSSSNKTSTKNRLQSSIPSDVKEWMSAEYNKCQFTRNLTHHDLDFLYAKLGIGSFAHGLLADPEGLNEMDEDRRQFNAFAEWYLACLASLKREASSWCSEDVMRICPFMVDRTIGESFLETEAAGTFIIRISSEPGCFVLSVKQISLDGEYIEHFLIDPLDLRRHPLSYWIMLNSSARVFLDVTSGTKFPKQFIFTDFASSYHVPHFLTNIDHRISEKELVFDSNTDSDVSTSYLNPYEYPHFVF